MWTEGADVFLELAGKYCDDKSRILTLWSEIQTHYSDTSRFYHTFNHLQHFYGELSRIFDRLEDPDAVMFALFYHDLVYHVTRGDNEEQSAAIARERLHELCVDPQCIARCTDHILATKSHNASEGDAAFFTDADLAILGSDSSAYLRYAENVRKEFAVYPDPIFKLGRSGVLQSFLKKDRIFKTEHFFRLYEDQARKNIAREISELRK